MNNEMRREHFVKETHWYYPGETIYRTTGRVVTACNQVVHARHEVNLQNPTCETCRKAMIEFNRVANEIVGDSSDDF